MVNQHARLLCVLLTVGLSDHSPMVIVWQHQRMKVFPFRFNNKWTKVQGFREIILQEWSKSGESDPLFTLCSKLKNTKSRLRAWAKEHYRDTHKEVAKMREKLAKI